MSSPCACPSLFLDIARPCLATCPRVPCHCMSCQCLPCHCPGLWFSLFSWRCVIACPGLACLYMALPSPGRDLYVRRPLPCHCPCPFSCNCMPLPVISVYCLACPAHASCALSCIMWSLLRALVIVIDTFPTTAVCVPDACFKHVPGISIALCLAPPACP